MKQSVKEIKNAIGVQQNAQLFGFMMILLLSLSVEHFHMPNVSIVHINA